MLPQLGGEINFVSVGLYVTPGVNIDGGDEINFYIIGFLCYHSWEVKSIFISVGLCVTPSVNIDGGG